MRLYIVRHGEAERTAVNDADRALSTRGGDAVRRFWSGLVAHQPAPTRILSSPLRRARETAATIGVVSGRYAAPGEQELLLPEAQPEDTLQWLARQPDLDGWVLVSHMPLVALLTGLLVDGLGGRYAFPLAGVACLDLEMACSAGGRLLWLEAPDAARGTA